MARIAGVDLPNNKIGEVGLTYIFGIGRSSAQKILDACGIDRSIKVGDWNDEQIAAIRASVTVSASLCADRAPRTTHVPVRVARRPSPTRRKRPNKS